VRYPSSSSIRARSALRFGLCAALSALWLAQPASAQTVDPARSSVSATFKQMGVPVEGTFRKVAGQVVYDRAAPDNAQARVEIDVASFDLGDAQYNAEVRKADWFDTARFPTATFATSAVKPLGADRFEASGKLTIKGRSVDVKLPVQYRVDGAAGVFEGSLPIRRLAFGIGDGEWKDTGLVADEVIVKFKLGVAAPR